MALIAKGLGYVPERIDILKKDVDNFRVVSLAPVAPDSLHDFYEVHGLFVGSRGQHGVESVDDDDDAGLNVNRLTFKTG